MLTEGMTIALQLKAIDNMSSVLNGATSKIGQDFDKLNRKINITSENIEKLGRKTKEIGESITGMGTTMVGVGGVMTLAMAKPIQAFAELENAQTRMESAFLSKNGVDSKFKEISKETQKLGMQLPGTTADFAEMASRLKELGVSSQVIANGGLRGSAYLRVLFGDMSPSQIADITSTFSKSLGIAQKDFVNFIDIIQRAKFGFGIDPEQFTYTLKYAGAVFKQLGVGGYNQSKGVVALAGALNQAGIRGEQLGTSMRAVLLTLPSLNAKLEQMGHRKFGKNRVVHDLLESSGIKLDFFDKKGEFKGLENFLAQLEKLKAFNTQNRLMIIDALFGKESAPVISELISHGVKGLKDANTVLQNQGSLDQRLTLIMGTLSNLWEAATGTLENTFAAFGKTIAPELKVLVTGFNNLSDKLGNLIDLHPRLSKMLALLTIGLGLTITTLGSVALVSGLVIAGVGKMTEFYGGLWTSLKNVNPALLEFIGLNTTAHNFEYGTKIKKAGNPLGLDMKNWSIGAGLGADIKRINKSLMTGIVSVFQKIIPASVLESIASINLFDTAIFSIPVIGWIAGIVTVIGIAAFTIYKYWKPITAFFRGIGAGLKEGLAPLKPLFSKVGKALHLAFAPLKPLLTIIGKLFKPVVDSLKSIWTWFTKIFTPINTAGKASESFGHKVGKAIGDSITWVVKLIGKLGSLIGKLGNVGSAIGNAFHFGGGVNVNVPVAKSAGKMGKFAVGSRYITHTGYGIIHQGEEIAPAGTVKSLRSGQKANSSTIVYSPTIHMGGSTPEAKQDLMKELSKHAHELKRMVDGVNTRATAGAY